MALRIASVPVLTGSAADRLEEQLAKSEKKRGKTDFSKKIAEARKILSKAKLS